MQLNKCLWPHDWRYNAVSRLYCIWCTVGLFKIIVIRDESFLEPQSHILRGKDVLVVQPLPHL